MNNILIRGISKEVLVQHIVPAGMDVETVISLARTSKSHYEVCFGNFRNFVNRIATSPSDNKHFNPGIEFCDIIDGRRMIVRSLALVKRNAYLFEKNLWRYRESLLQDMLVLTCSEYEKNGFMSIDPATSLFVYANKIQPENVELMKRPRVIELMQPTLRIEYDIRRCWAMAVLHVIAGFFAGFGAITEEYSLPWTGRPKDLVCDDDIIQNTNLNMLLKCREWGQSAGSCAGLLIFFAMYTFL